VFSHGFPELGYSWRHQFEPLVRAGYRVIAPDQRGYGESDKPEAITAYDIHHLCGDLVGILDALGSRRPSSLATTGAASWSGPCPTCTPTASRA